MSRTQHEKLHDQRQIAAAVSQRRQAMLDAREMLVGLIRGRLRQQHPHLSNQELNLKVLEEIERAQRIRPRFKSPGHLEALKNSSILSRASVTVPNPRNAENPLLVP